ncbi:MAG: sugar transferase [Ruminococcus sp.]|nr:sugar transferase [Ruminococcus sp.]
MPLKPFEKLPAQFQNEAVRKYYDILDKKRFSLMLKRISDIILSLLMILLLILPMAVISILIKCTSKGPVVFRQERITRYGKTFRIMKFRTMRDHADKMGALVTSRNDTRITKVGGVLRRFRLDELPQVFHVLSGNMSFVGTRPEVKKYVDRYTPEMYATLLMPAGVTSLASIKFKDENELIGDVTDPEEVDRIYMETILPQKMEYNLEYISRFGFRRDISLMFSTVKHMIS